MRERRPIIRESQKGWSHELTEFETRFQRGLGCVVTYVLVIGGRAYRRDLSLVAHLWTDGCSNAHVPARSVSRQIHSSAEPHFMVRGIVGLRRSVRLGTRFWAPDPSDERLR